MTDLVKQLHDHAALLWSEGRDVVSFTALIEAFTALIEAANALDAKDAEIARLKRNLDSRDDFLGTIGQWEAYVATLPKGESE